MEQIITSNSIYKAESLPLDTLYKEIVGNPEITVEKQDSMNSKNTSKKRTSRRREDSQVDSYHLS
jgi:hypothetical protein